MKKSAFLFTLFLLFLVACKKPNNSNVKQQTRDTLKYTTIHFINKWIDFGKQPNDTVLKAHYYFVNTGKQELIVNSVNPDCMCTGYNLGNDCIKPGDTAFVELLFHTKNKLGFQKIYTIVQTNTAHKFDKLTFTANIQNADFK